MSFINLLRGGVDTAVRARAAGQQAEEQQLPFLVQLAQMQKAQARQQSMDDLSRQNILSEISHRERPAPLSEDERFSKRVHDFQATGLTLDEANKQVALEMGKTPYINPIEVHTANRKTDVANPLPVTTPYAPAPTVGPDGLPTTGKFDRRTGEVTPGTIAKPAGTGSQGSQAPVSDMEQRYSEIEGHAKNVASGKLKIGRAAQTREGLEYGIANQSAGGHGVPLTQSIAAGAMDMLGIGEGKDYQEYQALMNSTRAFGDDAAKVFKGRQNEDAVKREIALSELQPGDYQNPTVVEQKLSRMRHIIELARQTMPGAGSAAPNTHPAPHAGAPAPASAGGRTIVVNGKTFQVPE